MITVNSKTAEQIKNAIGEITSTGLEIEEILEILQDWESRQLLTAKKIFATTAVLLAAAAFIGVDYRELTFWTLSEPAHAGRLTAVFFGMLVFSGVVYFYQRAVDLKQRAWQRDSFRQRIATVRILIKRICGLLGVEPDFDLLEAEVCQEESDHMMHQIALNSAALTAYYFYIKDFSPAEETRMNIERFEFFALYGLAVVGSFGLLIYWTLGI